MLNLGLEREESDFFESIGYEITHILDTKNNPGLDGIIELTYGYQDIGNGKRFNTTLFEKYCRVSFENGELIDFQSHQKISLQELLNRFKTQSNQNIAELKDICDTLSGKNQISDIVQKEAILKSIQSIILLIQYAQNSIEFEIEKAGFDVGLTENEREIKRNKNVDFEKILYGGKISDNPVESALVLEFMSCNVDEYDSKTQEEKISYTSETKGMRVLTSDEMGRLSGYIQTIKHSLGSEKLYEHKKEAKSETKIFLDSLKGVSLSREDTVSIFNQVLSFLGLPQTARVGNPGEVQSIYDSPTELVIPDTEEFSELGVERVLKLISHEILCHYINQQNHEKNNGKLRYFGNVEKEEGLAILAEKGLTGSKISGKDLITPPFARILAGEILEPTDFEDFIDLYSNITERKGSPSVLKSRHKRNQEDNVKGVQHKDVAYIRGLIALNHFLENDGDVENLFVGKVGLDAIKSGDYTFQSETMIFPFLLTDVYLFFLLAQKEGMKFTHSEFIKYIESKYGAVVKKESFAKVTKILGRKKLFELFKILRPLSTAITKSGIDSTITERIKRVDEILVLKA